MSLSKANEHRNAWFEGVQKCHLDESLYTVMERIVRAEVHRLVVVDENEKVIGIISLSDILLYLVLKPCGEGVGGSEQSLRETDPNLPPPKTEEPDELGVDAVKGIDVLGGLEKLQIVEPEDNLDVSETTTGEEKTDGDGSPQHTKSDDCLSSHGSIDSPTTSLTINESIGSASATMMVDVAGE